MRRLILILCMLALLAGFAVPTFAQSGQTIHIVDRGETLSGIARQYGVSVQALAAANSILNPNVLWAGMRLVIPTGVVYAPPPVTPPSTQPSYYIVRWGDTLAKIANNFGTSVWSIAQANNLLNLNQIYAGMYLLIPASSGTPTPPPQTVQYWIKPGDTLATIAWQFGMSVQTIASYNGINNPDQIFWGMHLVIPVSN